MVWAIGSKDMLKRKIRGALISLLNITCFLYGASATFNASAETVKRAYIDKRKNVHVVAVGGRDIQVTTKGNAADLKTAPDNKTVAWLTMNDWVAEGDVKPGSEELVIYRNGKAFSINCTPFIRDYWFWQKGDRVAIDCGGRRFAGRDILYDVKTLKKIESVDQAGIPFHKRPAWSRGDN